MAIQGGYSVDCGAIQAAGGLKHILIRPWIAGDLITTDLALNQVTRIQDSGGTDADWGVYESEIESSSITINGVNEGKDNTEYECTLSFFLPNLGRNQFRRLQEFQGQCLMVIGMLLIMSSLILYWVLVILMEMYILMLIIEIKLMLV